MMAKVINSLMCRLESIYLWLVCKEDEFMVIDEDKNMYYRFKKLKAQKIEYSSFEEKDLVLEKNGIKFYRK